MLVPHIANASTIHYPQTFIVATGILATGSIGTGFGNINNGSNTLTTGTTAISGALTMSSTTAAFMP